MIILPPVPAILAPVPKGAPCGHGVCFDEAAARRLLEETPHDNRNPVSFVMGSPAHAIIRKRWPRLEGKCPFGCGFVGIAYASAEHYAMGDW